MGRSRDRVQSPLRSPRCKTAKAWQSSRGALSPPRFLELVPTPQCARRSEGKTAACRVSGTSLASLSVGPLCSPRAYSSAKESLPAGEGALWATVSAAERPSRLGARVVLASSGLCGVVRYEGETGFAFGEWLGVELDEAAGKNDGCVNGVRYFDCAQGHGLFVREAALRRVEGPSTSPSFSTSPVTAGAGATAAALPPSPVMIPSPRDSATSTPAATISIRRRFGLADTPLSRGRGRASPEATVLSPSPCGSAVCATLGEDNCWTVGSPALRDMYSVDWANPELLAAAIAKAGAAGEDSQTEPNVRQGMPIIGSCGAAEAGAADPNPHMEPNVRQGEPIIGVCSAAEAGAADPELQMEPNVGQVAPIIGACSAAEAGAADPDPQMEPNVGQVAPITGASSAAEEVAFCRAPATEATDAASPKEAGGEATADPEPLDLDLETERLLAVVAGLRAATEVAVQRAEEAEARLAAIEAEKEAAKAAPLREVVATEVRDLVRAAVEEATAEFRGMAAEFRRLRGADAVDPATAMAAAAAAAAAVAQEGPTVATTVGAGELLLSSDGVDGSDGPAVATTEGFPAVAAACKPNPPRSPLEGVPGRSRSLPSVAGPDKTPTESLRVRDVVSQWEKILPSRGRAHDMSSAHADIKALAPWPFAPPIAQRPQLQSTPRLQAKQGPAGAGTAGPSAQAAQCGFSRGGGCAAAAPRTREMPLRPQGGPAALMPSARPGAPPASSAAGRREETAALVAPAAAAAPMLASFSVPVLGPSAAGPPCAASAC